MDRGKGRKLPINRKNYPRSEDVKDYFIPFFHVHLKNSRLFIGTLSCRLQTLLFSLHHFLFESPSSTFTFHMIYCRQRPVYGRVKREQSMEYGIVLWYSLVDRKYRVGETKHKAWMIFPVNVMEFPLQRKMFVICHSRSLSTEEMACYSMIYINKTLIMMTVLHHLCTTISAGFVGCCLLVLFGI